MEHEQKNFINTIASLFRKVTNVEDIDENCVIGTGTYSQLYHACMDFDYNELDIEIASYTPLCAVHDAIDELGIKLKEGSDIEAESAFVSYYGDKSDEMHQEWEEKYWQKESGDIIKLITPIMPKLQALPQINKITIGELSGKYNSTLFERVKQKPKKSMQKSMD